MSSMTALKLIIENQSKASVESSNRFQFIKDNHPSLVRLDWDGAEVWTNLIEAEIIIDDLQVICRQASALFILNNPVLLELAIHGRETLISNLNDDEMQVFRNGGLLDKFPSAEVVDWWDDLRVRGRTKLNQNLLIQGREAERWTIEFEIKKIAHLGKEFQPIWVALDGDHYGYDILSYRPNPQFAPLAVLIEVKSFTNPSKPQFYVTKNEWDKAVETGSNYIFFVWCTSTKSHKVFSHNELEPHIPKNCGSGSWQNVLITIENW